MSFAKWLERTLEVMAYAWRLATDEDYCLLADFLSHQERKEAPKAMTNADLAWTKMVTEMRAQKTRKMQVGRVTNLMDVRQLRKESAPREEYEPDPPALLGAYEPELALLFDSQRLLFPDHELGQYEPPEEFYDN